MISRDCTVAMSASYTVFFFFDADGLRVSCKSNLLENF